MSSRITARHLVVNAGTIIHEFGVLEYLRCLTSAMFSRRQVTFVEMAMRLRRS